MPQQETQWQAGGHAAHVHGAGEGRDQHPALDVEFRGGDQTGGGAQAVTAAARLSRMVAGLGEPSQSP
jgi:hypothetical protein